MKTGDLKEIYNSTSYLYQKCEFPDGSMSGKLLNFALESKALVPLLDASWKQTGQSSGFTEDKNHSGYLYLFALVLYDSITRGSNLELRQRLEDLRQNEEELKRFGQTPQEEQMIRRLFGLQVQ